MFALSLALSACELHAQVIGGPIAALVLKLDGKAGLWGWQWLFILVGSPTVLFGGLIKVDGSLTPGLFSFLMDVPSEPPLFMLVGSRTVLLAGPHQGGFPRERAHARERQTTGQG